MSPVIFLNGRIRLVSLRNTPVWPIERLLIPSVAPVGSYSFPFTLIIFLEVDFFVFLYAGILPSIIFTPLAKPIYLVNNPFHFSLSNGLKFTLVKSIPNSFFHPESKKTTRAHQHQINQIKI